MKEAKKAKQTEQESKQENTPQEAHESNKIAHSTPQGAHDISSPTPKSNASQLLIFPLLGGLTLLAYLLYKKKPETKEPPVVKQKSVETKQSLVFMQ